MRKLIITEEEKSHIKSLYNLKEQKENPNLSAYYALTGDLSRYYGDDNVELLGSDEDIAIYIFGDNKITWDGFKLVINGKSKPVKPTKTNFFNIGNDRYVTYPDILHIVEEIPKNKSVKNKMYHWYEKGKSAGQEIFDYIRGHEGFRAFIYDDKGPWPRIKFDPKKHKQKGTLTIGYGTTDTDIIKKYLKSGKEMSEEEAKRLSVIDINDAAECVKRWQKDSKPTDKNDRKLTKGMYMAMIDMAYNRGCGGLRNSGFIKEVEKGNYKNASNKIENGSWGHPKRRKTTKELFCRDGGC
jgi:GH24 family phage-related lysozyme (muramidase)